MNDGQKLSAPLGTTDPYVEIIEQPQYNGYRFRYVSEGKISGSILGEHSTDKKQTYPTLKVEYNKNIWQIKLTTGFLNILMLEICNLIFVYDIHWLISIENKYTNIMSKIVMYILNLYYTCWFIDIRSFYNVKMTLFCRFVILLVTRLWSWYQLLQLILNHCVDPIHIIWLVEIAPLVCVLWGWKTLVLYRKWLSNCTYRHLLPNAIICHELTIA